MIPKLLIKSFTTIELLIVIVIIGILANAIIPKIKGMQDKARYMRVEKDFQDLRTAIFMAQNSTGKPLKDITGKWCSTCVCTYWYWWPETLKNMDINHHCRVNLRSSLSKISIAAGMSSGALLSMELDPWWSPYLLEENYIKSAWPNQQAWIFYAQDNDDKMTYINSIFCSSAY